MIRFFPIANTSSPRKRASAAPKTSKRLHNYTLGLGLAGIAEYANASILGPKLCLVFNTVAGNDLYSIAAGVGLVALLIANAVNEGDNKAKTAALRIVTAGTLLINLQTLSTLITGSTWGC